MYNEGRKRGSVLNGRVIIMAENVRKVGKYKVKVITGENTSAEAISKRDKEMDNSKKKKPRFSHFSPMPSIKLRRSSKTYKE